MIWHLEGFSSIPNEDWLMEDYDIPRSSYPLLARILACDPDVYDWRAAGEHRITDADAARFADDIGIKLPPNLDWYVGATSGE